MRNSIIHMLNLADQDSSSPVLEDDENGLDVPMDQDAASSHSSQSTGAPVSERIPAAKTRLTRRADDIDLPEERERKRRKLDDGAGLNPPSQTAVLTKSFPRLTLSPAGKTTSFIYAAKPPTAVELVATTDHYNVPGKIYQAPYYSNESDAPERPREYAGLVFDLKGGTGIANLEEWKSEEGPGLDMRSMGGPSGVCGWEYASLPPGLSEVRKWLKENKAVTLQKKERSSQVSCLT